MSKNHNYESSEIIGTVRSCIVSIQTRVGTKVRIGVLLDRGSTVVCVHKQHIVVRSIELYCLIRRGCATLYASLSRPRMRCVGGVDVT